MINKDTIIYNLILMLNDEFDTQDIDNQDFIDYVCGESGLSEKRYRKIMKPLFEDRMMYREILEKEKMSQ